MTLVCWAHLYVMTNGPIEAYPQYEIGDPDLTRSMCRISPTLLVPFRISPTPFRVVAVSESPEIRGFLAVKGRTGLLDRPAIPLVYRRQSLLEDFYGWSPVDRLVYRRPLGSYIADKSSYFTDALLRISRTQRLSIPLICFAFKANVTALTRARV